MSSAASRGTDLWPAHTSAGAQRTVGLLAAGEPPLLCGTLSDFRGAPPEVGLRAHPADETCARGVESNNLEPHPLDYDWRFTSNCSERIADALVEMNRPVVLLGTPSLVAPLQKRDVPATLLDRNPAHGTGASEQPCDFRLMESRFIAPRGAVVLLDAPWYPEELGAWLSFAVSRIEGAELLVFSLWPEHTRPSAVAERDELLAGC